MSLSLETGLQVPGFDSGLKRSLATPRGRFFTVGKNQMYAIWSRVQTWFADKIWQVGTWRDERKKYRQ